MPNTRQLKDKNLIKTGVLPNAANTTYSNVLDLAQAEPYPVTERMLVLIESSGGNGANNRNINIRLQHSDTNNTSNFVNIPELAIPLLRITDNNGAGYNSGNIKTPLPPTVKRYIRSAQTGEANGGDASGGTVTVSLLF